MDFSIEMRDLYHVFLKDCGVSRRDVWYVKRRLTNEGLHFITKTLPKFSKFVLLALQAGHLGDPSELSEFAWKGGLPVFLRGYLKGIFDRNGVLLDEPDPFGLWVVRQVCEYSYKLALDFDATRLAKAERDFIETDCSLPTASDVDTTTLENIRKNVEKHYAFGLPDEILSRNRPRFGPGTYADSTRRQIPWYLNKGASGERSSVPLKFKGISGYFKAYPSSPEKVRIGFDTSTDSELLFVPKDSRGPRVIIREPMKCLMVQMSYFDYMVDALENQTHHRVNFRDQQINRDLAKQGSISGKWSTIDLSEASDRVSFSVVNTLFRNIPGLRYFIKHRSTHVKLPSGKRHKLNKLAGMGSGLTFATMAFLIHVTIATSLERYYGSYRKAASKVYVYGDDIIVPTVYAPIAMKALGVIGLKVNTSKSFTLQKRSVFRESCGGDYLCGQEVGPKRLKLTGGVDHTSGSKISLSSDASVLQLERHCRELVSDGFLATAAFYYKKIERYLGTKLPEISGDTPVLGRWSVLRRSSYEPSRTGKYRNKQCFVPIPVSKVHPSPNPYHFIGQAIKRHEVTTLDSIFGDVCRFDSYKVSIPRKIKLRRRRVSEFSLIG